MYRERLFNSQTAEGGGGGEIYVISFAEHIMVSCISI